MTTTADADFRAYLDRLRARQPFGPDDRAGTANLIDAAARARAVASLTSAEPVSLARPIEAYAAKVGDKPGFALEVHFVDGPIAMATDHLELDCHGIHGTHVDALNHIGTGGTWYAGWAVDDADGPSVADLADRGLVTRGVFADIPAVRGTDWVPADEPVTGDDIDRALSRAGVTFERGDALLLYMGRDRFEAAGHVYEGVRSDPAPPGVGRSGSEWIVDHGVSLLCWDFLDSGHRHEPLGVVHLLIWAIGLVLVDNCDFRAARPALQAAGKATGMLVVSPLRIPGATGCTVNPLLLL